MSSVHPEAPLGSPPPEDASPELAAAMHETRIVRERLASLCREFGPSPQTGWSARISLTVLNRYRDAASLDRLSRTPSNNGEDTLLRYRRERDEARAEILRPGELLGDVSNAKCDAIEERDRYRQMYEQAQAAHNAVARKNAELAAALEKIRELGDVEFGIDHQRDMLDTAIAALGGLAVCEAAPVAQPGEQP